MTRLRMYFNLKNMTQIRICLIDIQSAWSNVFFIISFYQKVYNFDHFVDI